MKKKWIKPWGKEQQCTIQTEVLILVFRMRCKQRSLGLFLVSGKFMITKHALDQINLLGTFLLVLENVSWGLLGKTFPSSSFTSNGSNGLTWKMQHASNVPLCVSKRSPTFSLVPFHTLCILLLCLFTPHLSLCPPSQGQRGPGRREEDSSAPIRRQKELVSIKWYVLKPQITDTCSLLPSHPVVSLLHHLMQCNHLPYLMKPYCVHSPPPSPCVWKGASCSHWIKHYNAWTCTALSTEWLSLPQHCKASNATVILL